MINVHDNQDETRSAFGLLKAGEQPDDRLTRCADLVPMAMRREQCDLAGAVRHVLLRLAELPAPDVFILRDGYAKPWQPGPVRRSGRRWTDGQPVPAGYRVEFVNHNGARPFVAGSHGGRIQLSASGQVLTWQRPGPEPIETHADLWERLGAEWLSLAPTGRIDRQLKSGRFAWASSLSIRQYVAVAAGLQDAALPMVGGAMPLHLVGLGLSSPFNASVRATGGGAVSPESGGWPHVSGTEWTEAEHVAAFKMRHISKLSGPKIAQIVGVSRQVLDDMIGGANSPITGTWPVRCTWRPTSELLKACGLNPRAGKSAVSQALQVMVAPGRHRT